LQAQLCRTREKAKFLLSPAGTRASAILDWPDPSRLVTEQDVIGTAVTLALRTTSFTISATRTLRIVAGARLGRNPNRETEDAL
jgi:hypothetical protein